MAYIFTAITGSDTVGQAFTKVNQNLQEVEINQNSGDFVPLTGTTNSNPFNGNLFGLDSASLSFQDFDTTQGIKLTYSAVTIQDLDDNINANLKFTPLIYESTEVNVSITDGLSDGFMVIAPDPSEYANKFVRVNPDANGWDYVDGASGSFLPLSGGTVTGNVTITNDNNFKVEDGETIYSTQINSSSIDFNYDEEGQRLKIQYYPITYANVDLNVIDTRGEGYFVIADNPSGNENKFIKVGDNGNSWEYVDGTSISDLIPISYGDAFNLQLNQYGGNLQVGRWYRITGRTTNEATNYNTFGDIVLLALTPNKFSPDGYLLAINADYTLVEGDYSDVPNFNSNVGVPYQDIYIDAGLGSTVIVIYNNRHWYFEQGYTLSSESDLFAYGVPLTKDYTTKNGYIIEPQKIKYNLLTNVITVMEDKLGNIVHSNGDNDKLDVFRFGDADSVYGNIINTSGYIDILNLPYGNLGFYNNKIFFGDILDNGTDLYLQSTPISFLGNIINDYQFKNDPQMPLYIQNATCIDNKILNGVQTASVLSKTLQIIDKGYEYNIISTGGTFNGIVTGFTQQYQIAGYYQKIKITNSLGVDLIFRNSTFIKTEGGLDAKIKTGGIDSIEFYLSGNTAYQININNYL